MSTINKIVRTIAGYFLIGLPVIILFILLAVEHGLLKTSIVFTLTASAAAIFIFFGHLGLKILDSRQK